MNYEKQKEAALDEYLDTYENTMGVSPKINKTLSPHVVRLIIDAFSKGFEAGIKCKPAKNIGSPPWAIPRRSITNERKPK